MATQKKTLLELMVEAGIDWPEGAKYAAQDKDTMRVRFYRKGKPFRDCGVDYWSSFGGSMITGVMVKLPELCLNWHQTIVTRKQYEAAADEKCNVNDADDTEQQLCESVTSSIQSSTIEQRIAELQVMERNISELRAELQVMERNLDEFRANLTDYLRAFGITWLDSAVVADDPKQPVVSDWRDLKVGDVIWWGGDSKHGCGEYTVRGIEREDYSGDYTIHLECGEWVDVQTDEWRFILRP